MKINIIKNDVRNIINVECESIEIFYRKNYNTVNKIYKLKNLHELSKDVVLLNFLKDDVNTMSFEKFNIQPIEIIMLEKDGIYDLEISTLYIPKE